MDTISMGVTIAFAYECFERGLLRESDVGCQLRFGNGAPILDLVEKTARREGIGDLLAEGSARMADRLGPDAARSLIAIKGLELPGHSARALKGMAIGYATATRGGSHHDARPTPFYVGREDRMDARAAPGFAVRSQHFTAVGDSLVQCRFVGERGGYGLFLDDTYALLLHYVTGWDCDAAEMEQIGERIYNAERLFNVREYVRRADDRLPWKLMHEPIAEGPSKGMYSSEDELRTMLDQYYEIRGWDQDGIPTAAKLRSLGLASYAAAAE
jgi:aldehyde:ferredoxin oxidoreductase